ncbi:Hypothetical predicted protein [Lecanosticta acicola]|uniref:Uncharacterized protein n=1 Tax=Lecanosticta acicola TaxID=111012 RepID=A0AAI9EEL7_9PEZI|nr:Hypothetical predicted protein [Lecanosticta acicola]
MFARKVSDFFSGGFEEGVVQSVVCLHYEAQTLPAQLQNDRSRLEGLIQTECVRPHHANTENTNLRKSNQELSKSNKDLHARLESEKERSEQTISAHKETIRSWKYKHNEQLTVVNEKGSGRRDCGSEGVRRAADVYGLSGKRADRRRLLQANERLAAKEDKDVEEHNQLVDGYNELLAEHDSIVGELKALKKDHRPHQQRRGGIRSTPAPDNLDHSHLPSRRAYSINQSP